MTHLENQLRDALARKEAPDGLSERIVAAATGRRPARFGNRWFAARRAIAAVLVTALLSGFWVTREYQKEKREGERARQLVMLALRITEEKTSMARERVQRPGQSSKGEENETSRF